MHFQWKYIIPIIIIIVLVIGAGFIISAKSRSNDTQAAGGIDKSKELYTCGMHPQVIQEGPGLCPICGMKLVPLSSMGDDKGGVKLEAATIQTIGVRYATVTRGPLEKKIRTAANVDYNVLNYVSLSIRADGWVDKLYVTSPGQRVSKGDPLMDFYSPKLYSAQEEYLISIRSGDSSLISASRERLRLLGIGDEEIGRIKSSGQKNTMTIEAPMDGYIVALGEASSGGGGGVVSSGGGGGMSSGGGGGGGGMGGMGGGGGSGGGGGGGGTSSGGSGGSASYSVGSAGTLKEGSFVGAGSQVFAIADLSDVWVYAHIYEDEINFIREGMDATFESNYLPGKTYEGKIDVIYPFVNDQTRDIKLRVILLNPDGDLRPGMFGKMTITSRVKDDALMIPEEAVLISGNKNSVFLKLEEGRFMPTRIKLGLYNGEGMVEVLDGLTDGDIVVTSAQFLLDSESRLKEALSKMLAAGEDVPAGHVHTPGMDMPDEGTDEGTDESATTDQQSTEGTGSMEGMDMGTPEKPKADTDMGNMTEPMPGMDHSSQETNWPGLAPDDPNAKYKCPMPGDRYYAAEPGDCPICGMKLIPNEPTAKTGQGDSSASQNGNWPNLAPDDPNAKYACPDAAEPGDHYFSAEPGVCPRCGMDMLPWDPTSDEAHKLAAGE